MRYSFSFTRFTKCLTCEAKNLARLQAGEIRLLPPVSVVFYPVLLQKQESIKSDKHSEV